MIRALHTAATGMDAQQMSIDIIANNLSNVNTPGYKKARINFQDLIYQTMTMAGASTTQNNQNPTGLQVGLGTKTSATEKMFVQGVLQQTENPLNLAIEGEGFFQVTLPDGTIGYTRDGSFKIDAEGNMVTSDGYLLEPNITIPQGAVQVSVGGDGTVSALVGGETEPQQVGQITLASFANPAGLTNMGKNIFRESPASGSAVVGSPGEEGIGTLASGFLEMSNVDVVKEMVEMISAQRAYQINSKVIQGVDTMLGVVADIKR